MVGQRSQVAHILDREAVSVVLFVTFLALAIMPRSIAPLTALLVVLAAPALLVALRPRPERPADPLEASRSLVRDEGCRTEENLPVEPVLDLVDASVETGASDPDNPIVIASPRHSAADSAPELHWAQAQNNEASCSGTKR